MQGAKEAAPGEAGSPGEGLSKEAQATPEVVARLQAELSRAVGQLGRCKELFRAVLDQSLDVVYRRNLVTDRYDYLSPAIEILTGYTVEEFSGIAAVDLFNHIHPDDHAVVQRRFKLFQESLRGKKINDVFEYRLKRKDGTYRWISDSGVLVAGPDGTPLYHVGVARDVTEHKRLEEELRQNNEKLEKTVAERTARLQRLASELTLAEQRERKRLSDFLHDDLQQVLAGAKFMAEQLEAKLSGCETRKDAGRLRDLMVEALGKTRLMSTELITPLLYVVGLVPALRQLALQMGERYGLDIDFSVQELPELSSDALKVHVFHSVKELLFNAAKHSGVKRVCLTGRFAEGLVEVTVADEGKGFDAQAVVNGASAEHGCGLFSISERIAAMGGELVVESAPGRGSRFTIRVPWRPEPEAEPQAEEPPGPAEPDRAAAEGHATILVADDHALMRQGVISLLSHGYPWTVVAEAANGREAVLLARKLRPDVIVMDVRMPELNGIEATRQIIAEAPDALVIGISAFGDAGFRTGMLDAGAAALLDKAYVGEELPALITECLARCKNRNNTEPEKHGIDSRPLQKG